MSTIKKDSTTAFCHTCKHRRAYERILTRTDCELRGVKFTCIQGSAVCTVCGESLDVNSIEKENEAIREYAYRKAAGLITVDEIRTILTRYDIGAGPLASLMGFGDVTINRYMGGQLPSRSNSDQLYDVLESHQSMRELLDLNNEYISDVAYRKCSQALDRLDELYSDKKIEVVTRYLLRTVGEITPPALQKLLYYAQGFYEALYDTPLFPDLCQAWSCGPVYPHIYQKYRDYGYDPVRLAPIYCRDDSGSLTASERDFLNEIIHTFGSCSGSVLGRMIRCETPWLDACGDLPSADRYPAEINPESMRAHFKKVIKKHNIVNPDDISKYCDALFRQVQTD